MIKISYLFSFVLLLVILGCSHSLPPNSNIHTPITLSIESIKSSGSVTSQSFSKDKVGLLEKKLDDISSITQTKGISAAVAIPDKGFWYATRGKTGNPLKENITPNLKFCTGSIGKIFTAVVIFSLIEERLLSMESPVIEWLPEMTHTRHMTINHLLTHTSGIASFNDVKDYESHQDLYRNPIEVILYLKNKKLLFEPGQHYAYSNINYLMLGIIIERITGKSYKESIEEYIIHKMNLQETDVMTVETLNNLMVRGHHQGNVITEAEKYTIPFAAGSILASPRDLILFLHALMKGRLLSQESLQTMFSEMNLMDAAGTNYYGKGIVANPKTPVGEIIGHRGGIIGFGASLYYHPKKNMFVCVMMNDDIKSPDPAVFRFMEAMIDL